ncbi:MAG: hypothetical protein ACR2NL_02720 [Acidimicrobiia bacterium]
MDWLKKIPMASLAIIVGTIVAIGWIAIDGTVPLIMSIAGGGLIALKATLGDPDDSEGDGS